MPEISIGAPMTTAVTDLITAVVVLPLMLSLHAIPCKDKTLKRLWLALFLSIGAGSFLGFIAHVFVWSTRIYSIIWVFLYAVLFQVLHIFLRLSLHAALGAQWLSKWRKRLISVSVILLYLLTAALELAGINPIRLFVVYCIVMAAPGLYLFAKTAIQKKDPAARTIWFSFLPQLPGVVFQLLRQGEFMLVWVFDYNSIYHLCLLVSVIFFYISARQMMLRENK